MSFNVNIALVGTEAGIKEARESLKFPDVIKTIFVWSDFLFDTEKYDFLRGYDMIIVASPDEEITAQITEFARNVCGTNPETILDYYKIKDTLGPLMLADRLLLNNNISYDGMILGISNAETGIMEKRFTDHNFINLAIASQDIYSNYQVLRHCIENYHDNFRNLEYIIFDLYDYSYFNYDISRAHDYAVYLLYGGYNLDSHNLALNKNIPIGMDEIMKTIDERRRQGISDNQLALWKMIGKDTPHDADAFMYQNRRYKKRHNYVTEQELGSYRLGSYASKVFQDTVDENISIFEELLDLIYSFNSDMKVLFVNLPRYAGVSEITAPMKELWKDRFYGIIEDFNSRYPFDYIDFTDHEISTRKELFGDPGHFNLQGAMLFTDMLKEYLFR